MSLPWVLERTEPGSLAPRYLGVIHRKLCWTSAPQMALRFADQESADAALLVIGETPFQPWHLNGTEKPAEMA